VSWRLFESVPADELREVIAIARRRAFVRGEVVFHDGDPSDTLHLVVKGRFAVKVVTPRGDVAVLWVCGPGDAFGELALVSPEEPRSATVAALEPAVTHAVHRLDFERLRREHPEIDQVLVAVLADQVRRMSGLVVDAYYTSAERRVLRRLADLVGTYGAAGGADPVVVPVTQEQLAELAGTSRATVNHVLREEEVRGTVVLGRGRTTVRDPAELARRAR
jgi:CRP/FNR family cyclic AMP-dependent transcriptional regulator